MKKYITQELLRNFNFITAFTFLLLSFSPMHLKANNAAANLDNFSDFLDELREDRGRDNFGRDRGRGGFGRDRGRDNFGRDRGRGGFGRDRGRDDFGRDRGRDDFGRDRGRNDFGRDRGRDDFGRDRGRGGFRRIIDLGVDKIDKFIVAEYRFRTPRRRAVPSRAIILSSRKAAVDIHRIEIVYNDGYIEDLRASGIIRKGSSVRLRIERGRVRAVLITAISPNLFGSRARLSVSLVKKRGGRRL